MGFERTQISGEITEKAAAATFLMDTWKSDLTQSKDAVKAISTRQNLEIPSENQDNTVEVEDALLVAKHKAEFAYAWTQR